MKKEYATSLNKIYIHSDHKYKIKIYTYSKNIFDLNLINLINCNKFIKKKKKTHRSSDEVSQFDPHLIQSIQSTFKGADDDRRGGVRRREYECCFSLRGSLTLRPFTVPYTLTPFTLIFIPSFGFSLSYYYYNNQQVLCCFNYHPFSFQSHHSMLYHPIRYSLTHYHSNLYKVTLQFALPFNFTATSFIQFN